MIALTFSICPSPAGGRRRPALCLVGLAAALASALAAPPSARAQDTTTARSSRFGSISGVVIDSLHGTPLVNADVEVEGSSKSARTDSAGNFHIDSLAPGPFRLGVFHPLLDSIGVGIASPPLTVTAGTALVVTLATPAGPTIATVACRNVPAPVGRLATPQSTGPSVILGRVLDADTDQPIGNVAVSFTWAEFEASKEVGFHRIRHTRQATTGPGGDFQLCHVPTGAAGTLQAARRDGGAAAAASSVSRDLTPNALLSLVTLHLPGLSTPTIASLAATATAPSGEQPAATAAAPGATTTSRGPASTTATSNAAASATSPTSATAAASPPTARHYASGIASLTGKVLNPQAVPVGGAKVYVMGAADSALSDQAGEFSLHNLPSGTRTLVVRAVGYEPVSQPVELSAREPRRVIVPFTARAVPSLRPVIITARLDQGLKKVGFDLRRRAGTGTYWTLPEIDKHKAYEFHDLFTTFPGIRVDHKADGRSSLMATRGEGGCIGYSSTGKITPGANCGPCMAFVIDGTPYTENSEGDMDDYVHPQDIGAIEIYQEHEAPRSIPGLLKPDCTNIVIWTKAKLGV